MKNTKPDRPAVKERGLANSQIGPKALISISVLFS